MASSPEVSSVAVAASNATLVIAAAVAAEAAAWS